MWKIIAVQTIIRIVTVYSRRLRSAHENPDASMAELADLCGITKSGLAHRFRKIASMAETLAGKAKGRK